MGGSEVGIDELASRAQVARRLHWVLLVVVPVLFAFVVRSGVRFDHAGGVLFLCVAWWPVLLWGALARTRRPRLQALLVVVPVYSIGVLSLIDIGLVPGAAAALLLCIVLVGLFFGRGAAWGVTLLVVMTYFAVGAAFCAGWFAVPDPALSDLAHPGVWIRMAVSQTTIGIVLVSAVTTLISRYERSLGKTREALDELRTEQEARQREAQEAIRRRDDFLVIAGHELRTPLTPLLLEVQALQRRVQGGELGDQGSELAARLQRTTNHVLRLVRLVDELLDVSRVLSGKLTVRREPVNLAALARSVAERFAEPLARSGSTIVMHPLVECIGLWDRSGLDQVITNLLSNAIKYGAGEPIELSIEATDDTVTLVMRDHGIGIEEEARARVFGRFERAVRSHHYGGFGVGLWVAKQIIEALEGSVRLDSTLGAGTTVSVALPRGALAVTPLEHPNLQRVLPSSSPRSPAPMRSRSP